MIMVDTSVWIDFFRGKDNFVTERLISLKSAGYDIYTCGIVLEEIIGGIKNDNKRKIVQEKLLNLRFVEPAYPDTYLNSSLIYSEGRKRGRKCVGDYWADFIHNLLHEAGGRHGVGQGKTRERER